MADPLLQVNTDGLVNVGQDGLAIVAEDGDPCCCEGEAEICRSWVKGYWCCDPAIYAWFPVYACCYRGPVIVGQQPWPVCGCPRDPGVPDYPCYFPIPLAGNPVLSVLGTCYRIQSDTIVDDFLQIPADERNRAVAELVNLHPGEIRIAPGGCGDLDHCLECPDCCHPFRVYDAPYCAGGPLGEPPDHCCECPSEYEFIAQYTDTTTRVIDKLCVFGCPNGGAIAPTLIYSRTYTERYHFRVRCVGRVPGQTEGQLVGECVNASWSLVESTANGATVNGCPCGSGPTVLDVSLSTITDGGVNCDIANAPGVLAPCSLGPQLAIRWFGGVGDNPLPPNPGEPIDGRLCSLTYRRDPQPGDQTFCGDGISGTYTRTASIGCTSGAGSGSVTKRGPITIGATCQGIPSQFGADGVTDSSWSWSYEIVPAGAPCFDNPCGTPGTQAPTAPLFLTPDRQVKRMAGLLNPSLAREPDSGWDAMSVFEA